MNRHPDSAPTPVPPPTTPAPQRHPVTASAPAPFTVQLGDRTLGATVTGQSHTITLTDSGQTSSVHTALTAADYAIRHTVTWDEAGDPADASIGLDIATSSGVVSYQSKTVSIYSRPGADDSVDLTISATAVPVSSADSSLPSVPVTIDVAYASGLAQLLTESVTLPESAQNPPAGGDPSPSPGSLLDRQPGRGDRPEPGPGPMTSLWPTGEKLRTRGRLGGASHVF